MSTHPSNSSTVSNISNSKSVGAGISGRPQSHGVTCHLSSCVFLLFLLHSPSLSTLFSTQTYSNALYCTAVALSHIDDLIGLALWLVITLPNKSLLLVFTDPAKSSKSSAHLHSYYDLPLFPMTTLIMCGLL